MRSRKCRVCGEVKPGRMFDVPEGVRRPRLACDDCVHNGASLGRWVCGLCGKAAPPRKRYCDQCKSNGKALERVVRERLSSGCEVCREGRVRSLRLIRGEGWDEAKVAYDDQNFYAFIRMYDPHPDSILRLLGLSPPDGEVEFSESWS